MIIDKRSLIADNCSFIGYISGIGLPLVLLILVCHNTRSIFWLKGTGVFCAKFTHLLKSLTRIKLIKSTIEQNTVS